MVAELQAHIARTASYLQHHNTIRVGATVWLGLQPLFESSHGKGARLEFHNSEGNSWDVRLDDAVARRDQLLDVQIQDARPGVYYSV